MLICLLILGQTVIEWQFDPDSPTQALVKATAPSHANLQVWHASYFGQGLPPMLGEVSKTKGEIVFKPRFPFEPGQKYCALLSVAGKTESKCFTFPAIKQTKAQIVSVWPPDSVPANLMRFYITFDKTMGNVDPVPFTTLKDEKGEIISDAFVEVQGGLWDPNHRRVTFIIHPGRTKQEVGPNQVLGPVLTEGKNYTLTIRNLPTARGSKSTTWQHQFQVIREDRQEIKPSQWEISTVSGTLAVRPGIDIDPFTFMNHTWVLKAGKAIEGMWQFHKGTFQWKSSHMFRGQYELQIGSSLEDWAGNRPGVSFERDQNSKQEQPYKLSFEVK